MTIPKPIHAARSLRTFLPETEKKMTARTGQHRHRERRAWSFFVLERESYRDHTLEIETALYCKRVLYLV